MAWRPDILSDSLPPQDELGGHSPSGLTPNQWRAVDRLDPKAALPVETSERIAAREEASTYYCREFGLSGVAEDNPGLQAGLRLVRNALRDAREVRKAPKGAVVEDLAAKQAAVDADWDRIEAQIVANQQQNTAP